jgi:hypothetical protein
MAKMQKRALQMEEQKKIAAAQRAEPATKSAGGGGKRQPKVGNVSGGAEPIDPKKSRVMTGRARPARDDAEK